MAGPPKIGSPSSSMSKGAIIGIVSIMIIFLCGLGYLVMSARSEKDDFEEISYQVPLHDDRKDFFNLPKDPEPKIEEELKIETPPPPPPPVKKKTPPPPPPPVKQVKLPALNKILKTIPDDKTKPSVRINNLRRTAGASNFKKLKRTSDPSWINSQDEWNEDKTESSYPVDMSRVIPMNKYIPAILVNDVVSELGSKVTAVIEQNIYGGHGRFVLIPAGSSAIGFFAPLKKAGDTRLRIIWHRIITPKGINIHCGNAEMTDAMGRSGITGEVDSKFFDRIGLPLMISAIQSALAYAMPIENRNQQVVIENFGQGVSTLSQKVFDSNVNLKPVVKIPAASRILISPMKDIWFPKPENNEIQLSAVSK